MDCPNCGVSCKQESPDKITCPTCGPLTRNGKNEWEPGSPVPELPPANPEQVPPPKPPEPENQTEPVENDPDDDDGLFIPVGLGGGGL